MTTALASAEKVIAKLSEDVNQIRNIPHFDKIVKDIRELPNSSVSRVIKGVFESGSVVITCDLMVSWKFRGWPTPFKIYFPFTYPDAPPTFVLKVPNPAIQCIKRDHECVGEDGVVVLSQLTPWSSSIRMSNLLGEMRSHFENDYPIRQDDKSKRNPPKPFQNPFQNPPERVESPKPVEFGKHIKKVTKRLTVKEAFKEYNIKETGVSDEYLLEEKTTGQKFVGKVIQFRDGSNTAQARKEVLESYLNFNLPNIVRCFDAIQLDEDLMGLVLELCEGDSLAQTIAKVKNCRSAFSNDSICKVIVQYGRGLKGLHDMNYVHRDIKPENLLTTTDGVFKLSDLSASIKLENINQGMQSLVGQEEYTAPEIMQGSEYSFRVDIYSFGVVLYEMVMLANPYTVVSKDGKSRISNAKQMQADYNLLVSPAHNPALLQLIKKMLSLDPVKRPTMFEILQSDFILDFIQRTGL